MTTQEKEREAIRREISRSAERSPLFWYLLENYDWIAGEAVDSRLRWTRLALRFAEMGLTDNTGKAASSETCKQTWKRVRKERLRRTARRAASEADRAAKAEANPRRNMPSQFAKRNYAPPLALSPQTPSNDKELWMGKYSFDGDGMIIVIDNPSSGVYAQQERNLRSSRPINDGIERFIKSKG